MDNRFTYKPAITVETSREKNGGRFTKISGYGSHVPSSRIVENNMREMKTIRKNIQLWMLALLSLPPMVQEQP